MRKERVSSFTNTKTGLVLVACSQFQFLYFASLSVWGLKAGRQFSSNRPQYLWTWTRSIFTPLAVVTLGGALSFLLVFLSLSKLAWYYTLCSTSCDLAHFTCIGAAAVCPYVIHSLAIFTCILVCVLHDGCDFLATRFSVASSNWGRSRARSRGLLLFRATAWALWRNSNSSKWETFTTRLPEVHLAIRCQEQCYFGQKNVITVFLNSIFFSWLRPEDN